MKYLSLLLVCCATLLFQGCDPDDVFDCKRGRGDVIVKTYDLPRFSKIRLEIPAYVHLSQGDFGAVTIEGKEDIIDLIELDVQSDAWDIEFDRCTRDIGRIDIYITLPEIKRIIVEGSGDVIGENFMTTHSLELVLTGSGGMDLGVDVKFLDTRIEGSGDIYLEGTGEYNDTRIIGSGDVLAFGLITRQSDIEIIGSGDVQIFVEEYLKVLIEGSGDVYYKGHPELNLSLYGSGSVYNAN